MPSDQQAFMGDRFTLETKEGDDGGSNACDDIKISPGKGHEFGYCFLKK